MRLGMLFVRWLVIIGVLAAGVFYLSGSRSNARKAERFEMIPLVQSERSLGLPLAGVLINPEHRDVFAVVGGGGSAESAARDFFIVWKMANGATYSARFPKHDGAPTLCEMAPDGVMLSLRPLAQGAAVGKTEAPAAGSGEDSIRSILDALPERYGFSTRTSANNQR